MACNVPTSVPISLQSALLNWSPTEPVDLQTAPPVTTVEGVAEIVHQARILVVDDVEANATLLRQLLLHGRYAHVDITTRPSTVRDLHAGNPYDLILITLDMKEMDGIEVMHSLDGADPDGFVPVIVLSTHPGERLRALKAGALDFFSNPIDLSEVLTRITNTLELRMLHRALRQRQRKLERDLASAVEICDALLPTTVPQCPGYEIVASSRSAGETSGDVYDVVRASDGGLVLLVADATGHGVGPAISATQLRAMLRMALRLDTPLDRIVTEANRQLRADLPAHRFVTAFFGELDPTTHAVRYLAPGQGPLLHWHAATQTAEWRNASCPPLGVASAPFQAPAPIHLEPGDLLMVATDGIFERTDRNGQMFGEDGVVAVMREAGHASAETIRHVLQCRVDQFAGTLEASDDATVVILKRLG